MAVSTLMVVMLLPVVVAMGVRLPQDWAVHTGHGLPGTAVVVTATPIDGHTHTRADVLDASGHLVATHVKVRGLTSQKAGHEVPVTYLPSDTASDTAVYATGHDPFRRHLVAFLTCVAGWLAALVTAAGRTVTRPWPPTHAAPAPAPNARRVRAPG